MLRPRGGWLFALTLTAALLPAPTWAADVDKYLPTDSDVVICVNVRQLLDSALVKKYVLMEIQNNIKSNAGLQEALKAFGLDPLKDVSTVTVAGPASRTTFDKGLAIVHGTFNLDKIQTAAAEYAKKNPDALKVLTEGKVQVYEARNKDDGSKPAFAAFLDKQTLVVSPTKSSVLDAAKAGSQPTIKKDLQALVTKADAKQSLWVAGLATKDLKEMLAENPQLKNIAGKLQHLAGGIAVTTDISADIKIQTSDAKAAMDIRNLLDGIKALLTLAVTDQKNGALLADILAAIKLTNTPQGAVSIEGKVTAADIEKGLKKSQNPQ